MKKIFLSLVASFTLLFQLVTPAFAQSFAECEQAVYLSIDQVMGISEREEDRGYLQQLNDLLSTQTPPHVLIDEVQELARDARIELKGLCNEVGKFDRMEAFYAQAYHLQTCRDVDLDAVSTDRQLNIVVSCKERSDAALNEFLNSLRGFLLEQTLRVSIDPVLHRFRALNARLMVLSAEYARLVNNFFTFNFRLGDAITGEWD